MRGILVLALVFVAGCDGGLALWNKSPDRGNLTGQNSELSGVRPQERPTSETLESDPSDPSAEQTPVAAVAAGPLGTTIASLGDPARPGLWIETPLARAKQPGQVRFKGRVTPVTLIPVDGPETGGSRLSLAAMRALGVALTDLVEVQVSAGG